MSAGRRVAVRLADLRLALELPEGVAWAAQGVPGRAAAAADAGLALRVRLAPEPEAPRDGARVPGPGGRELRLRGGALGAVAAELEGGVVRRVLRLDGARREGEIELAEAARADGVAPLDAPFDALLLATRLAREGALLLHAAAVVRRGAALAFTLRTRAARAAVAGLVAEGRPGVLARRRLVVRRAARGPLVLDGELGDAAAPPQPVPLAAVHLLHPAGQLVAEPRCGSRAADALIASAALPVDPADCVASYATAAALAGAVPVVRLGCPEAASLRRFADGADRAAAA